MFETSTSWLHPWGIPQVVLYVYETSTACFHPTPRYVPHKRFALCLKHPLVGFCRHCQLAPSNCRVLHPGCGNSLLGRDLHAAGFREVVNTDYVESVVTQMKEHEVEGLTWETCDMTCRTRWPPGYFDLVRDTSSQLLTFMGAEVDQPQ